MLTPLVRSTSLVGAIVLALAAGAAWSQSAIKSGVMGKITIDKKLLNATDWPVSGEELARLKTSARIRRPSAYPVDVKWTEPVAALKVVIDGVKVKSAEGTSIAFDGLRFVPSHALVAKPSVLQVENRQEVAITVVVGDKQIGPINPGGRAVVPVDAGESTLSTVEFPFAKAQVLALEQALVLPIEKDGTVPTQAIEGGDYTLGFYYGARKVYAQPLSIPSTAYKAIVASVSENLVVAVSIKDGGLQIAAPVRRVPPPRAPVANEDDEQ